MPSWQIGLKPGAERIARAAGERLANVATRLMFDPGLRSEPRVTFETECDITGGLSSNNFTHLSAIEWDFIGGLVHPKTLGEIAEELDWSEQALLDMAWELVA